MLHCLGSLKNVIFISPTKSGKMICAYCELLLLASGLLVHHQDEVANDEHALSLLRAHIEQDNDELFIGTGAGKSTHCHS